MRYALIGAYSETSGISAEKYARAVELGYLYGAAGIQMEHDTKAKTLYIVTAFIGKQGYMKEVSQFIDAQSPDATPESEIASTSIHSIPNSAGNVNSSSENNSRN